MQALLAGAKLNCDVCADAAILAEEIERDVGTVLFTDTAFADAHILQVLDALHRQPQWSDIPVIVLSKAGAQSRTGIRILDALTNVTLLDRPSSSRTLLSSIQAALRARSRQYELREHLKTLHASEAALRNAGERLEEANRRKDEFLAMLAHELRNPLAPIRNVTEVLDRKLPADTSLKPLVEITKRQVAQLARLVDDLLDISRITENRIELRQARLEVGAIIAQATESVDALMREKRHKLLVRTRFTPLYVEGDHARLVQCLSNVLTNAAKYTDPGGEIRLEVQPHGSTVAIVVSDNGAGIPATLLPRIFDLFVQGERTLDRSQGGLGIGLSVVKRLIEMHGGHVVAKSDGLGLGATFELHLPLADGPPSVQRAHSAAAVRSRRILIVDDNVDAANALAILLKLEGHETEAAYRARDAIERASAFNADVVVLDIGLPEMDGYTVAEHIRARHNGVHLIALTGYGQPEDIERAYARGFDHHMTKPADPTALLRLIDECRTV